MSEITKHQQQGISLRAFAEQTGIQERQLLRYIKQGRIMGARKHPLTKKWWIYPPAKLLFPDSSQSFMRYSSNSHARRQQVPQARAGVGFEAAAAPGRPAPRAVGVAFDVAVDVAFDVGTSPHGLSAMPAPSVPQPHEPAAPPPLASPVLPPGVPALPVEPETRAEMPEAVPPGILPDVFAAPEVQATMRSIKREAGEAHYPLVLSGSQMKLMERALSLAIDEAIDAMSDEPGGRHEIKPDLDACNQLYRTLKAAKAARKTANEDWRGMEL